MLLQNLHQRPWRQARFSCLLQIQCPVYLLYDVTIESTFENLCPPFVAVLCREHVIIDSIQQSCYALEIVLRENISRLALEVKDHPAECSVHMMLCVSHPPARARVCVRTHTHISRNSYVAHADVMCILLT